MKFVLVEDVNTKDGAIEFVESIISNLTYQQLEKVMDYFGGYTNGIDKTSPCYVNRYGDVISVGKSKIGTQYLDGVYDRTHEEYARYVLYYITKDEPDIIQDYIADNLDTLVDMVMAKTLSLGVFRLNTGSTNVEERFYCTLPDKKDFILNGSQYDTLDKFIWSGYDSREDLQVIFGDDLVRYYIFDKEKNTPESVLSSIKDYYKGITVREGLEDGTEVDSEGNPLSPEQVEFFKDSVIRDKNGRLLVCYHASNADFDEFDRNKIKPTCTWGSGFYFSSVEEDSYEYGEKARPFYLNAKKVIHFGDYGEVIKIAPYLEQHGVDIKGMNIEDKQNGYFATCPYDYGQYKYDKIIDDAIKSLGYDGKQTWDTEYVVFDPNQIKSITNKNPTNSDNINEADQLSMDIDDAVASQVKRDIEEKEHQLESAMYYHYKDSLAGYNGADVKVSPDDTATIVTHWNVGDMSEELEYDVVKLFDQFEFRETQPHRVNDLKKTITFYISLGYGGSLDKEELKKEFLTLLAKNGTSDYTDRGFILPDGSLVGNEKFGRGGEPHYHIDDMITRKMAITNGVDEDEIIGAFGLKNNSRGLVADLCGCIRVNGFNEDYISLPPNKPTRQQLDTLEEWIDNFFEIRGYNDYLYVTDFYGNNQNRYYSPEYEGKDIIDRIVRFYNTGNLYEEKQDSEETKQDFGEGKQDCKIKRKILKGRK